MDRQTVRIVVVEGVESALSALTHLLVRQTGWSIAYSATRAFYLLDAVRRERPDVAIVGESALGCGVPLVRRICQLSDATAVVVRLDHADPDATEEYLRAGARGSVEKDIADEELLRAIRRALEGGFGLSPATEDVLIPHLLAASAPDATLPEVLSAPTVLSRRERQVYLLLGKGQTAKEIARALKISPQTVAYHKHRLRKKLGFRTSAQLCRQATEQVLLNEVGPDRAAVRIDAAEPPKGSRAKRRSNQ